MGAFKLNYRDYFYCTKKCNKANHLGNVLTLFTDKKIPVGTGSTVSYYKVDLVSSMDYSPFGAPLKGRTFNGSGSRYGFNGQEKDNEVSGAGNSMTAEFWQYDARLGRRWNQDPIVKPNESPYLCFGGNPIYHNDPDGDDYGVTTKKGKDGKITEAKVSAKIFIKGDGASADRAAELTKAAQETFKTKTVDGVKVSFDVQYVFDPNKKSEDLNSNQGENLLRFNKMPEPNDGPNRSGVSSSSLEESGNTGRINNSGKDNYTVLHESLRLTGLSDRYSASGANKGYEKDIMGARGQMTLKTSHYKNIVEWTQNQHKLLTPQYPNLKYIYSHQTLDLKIEGGKSTLKR